MKINVLDSKSKLIGLDDEREFLRVEVTFDKSEGGDDLPKRYYLSVYFCEKLAYLSAYDPKAAAQFLRDIADSARRDEYGAVLPIEWDNSKGSGYDA